LLAPVTNTNRTLTLPDVTGTVAVQNGTGVGKVLQVVQTQLTSVQTFAPGAGVFTNVTGASASITPASASNKILVMYSTFMASSQNTAYWMQYLRMLRDGTPVAVGTQASYKATGAANYSANNQYGGPVVQSFIDSPATTSAITYQLSAAGESGFSVGGAYTTGASNPSIPTTIILMEIAG
jgi:hypothetical protein